MPKTETIPEENKTAGKRIYKAFLNYKMKKVAKNKLNALKALKKYENLPQQNTMTKLAVVKREKQRYTYAPTSMVLRSKKGGLMEDRVKARDLIIQENKEKQLQAEKSAREKIGNALLAYNFKRDYLQELKLRKEIETKTGEKLPVRQILETAITGLRDKLEAKRKLQQQKLIKTIKNEKILDDLTTSKEPKVEYILSDLKKLRKNDIFSSIAKEASDAGLSRLVELEGKKYVANDLATEAQNILPTLKTNTLAQKLGLEERNMENNKFFSNSNIRKEEMPFYNPMTEAKKENSAAQILQSVLKRKLNKEKNNLIAMDNLGDLLSQNVKKGRFVKGSQEAKDFMASVRANRKPKAPKRTAEEIKSLLSRARLGKGRRYAGGRPRKTPSVAEIVEAVVKKPRGRPRKIVAPSVATIVEAVAKKPRGRPRKIVAPKRTATEISALIARAKFMRSKPRGRPAKNAKEFAVGSRYEDVYPLKVKKPRGRPRKVK